MSKYLCLLLCLFSLDVLSQSAGLPALIPQPVSVTQKAGLFTLKENFTIGYSSSSQDLVKTVADHLSRRLSTPTAFQAPVEKLSRTSTIRLRLRKNPTLGDEGYQVIVYPDSVSIVAQQPAGLFYGAQTFLQLLPKEIERKQTAKGVSWTAACTEIIDYPRFAWRGILFDVARHFFSKEQVKQFIDEMVRYKYNVLHLHLTDDQGWRIEIKSLPKLTQVGAWRAERVGKWGSISKPDASEPKTYGGFYTQDDIREIVEYARKNFVKVLPEIEMPGHSLAIVASYPEVSCTPGNYQVNAGEKFIDWRADGFDALLDNNLCPANEKVYEYLDKIFGEVATLFPFEYIHMGGDECAKNPWMNNAAIKQLMTKEKLKNMDEVQSYFVKRVEKLIQSKGKKMIGWDEILEGGLAPNATVMSWRGTKGGMEAAKLGHPVVMTPNTHVYIDLYQGDPVAEPHTYSMLRLNQSYAFEPLPEGIDPKLILGGQANLWSEQILNMRHAQYMTWPRALAVAESVWSPKEAKNWNNFVGRTEKHFARFDEAEQNYSKSMFDCIFKAGKTAAGALQIELSTEVEGLDIFYSFDESNPDKFYPKYSQPLLVPRDAATLKVITYRNGRAIGKQINMPVEELKKRAGL